MALHHSPRIVTDGLLVYLDAANPKSYPGSGSTWTNLGSTKWAFPISGDPTFSNGALVFDGVDDSVDLANSTPSNYLTNNVGQNFSLFITLKPLALSTHMALISQRVGESMSFSLANNGKPYLRMDDDGGTVGATTSALSVGQWGEVGVTFVNNTTASYAKFFFNGKHEATQTIWDGSGIGTSAFLWVGTQTRHDYSVDPRHLNAHVSNVKIYSRDLTDDEVKQNFNAHRGRFDL